MARNEREPVAAVPEGSRRLAEFSNAGYSNGRRLPWMAAWWIAHNLFFSAWWFPARLRPSLLRFFGADVGRGCLIRHGIRLHWPWRLHVGDDVWIGEGVWLHTIEDIWIEDNVCISQRASVTTGSHDARDPHFRTDNGPIRLRSGCWVGAEAMVMRGVTVGLNSVVGARALCYKDVPDNAMVLYPEPRARSIEMYPEPAVPQYQAVADTPRPVPEASPTMVARDGDATSVAS